MKWNVSGQPVESLTLLPRSIQKAGLGSPAAVKLALATKTVPTTSTLANLSAAPVTVSSALNTLNSDPTANADFYAALDPQAAAWTQTAVAPLGASTSALAMLNNIGFGVPVVTDPTGLGI